MADTPRKGAADRADVTTLLSRARSGSALDSNELFQLLYQELRTLARKESRRRGGEGNTTTLVHEAYLRFKASGGAAATPAP